MKTLRAMWIAALALAWTVPANAIPLSYVSSFDTNEDVDGLVFDAASSSVFFPASSNGAVLSMMGSVEFVGDGADQPFQDVLQRCHSHDTAGFVAKQGHVTTVVFHLHQDLRDGGIHVHHV